MGLSPTQEELDQIIETIDTDNDGTVDYSEFLKLMTTKLKGAKNEAELLEAFNVFDMSR